MRARAHPSSHAPLARRRVWPRNVWAFPHRGVPRADPSIQILFLLIFGYLFAQYFLPKTTTKFLLIPIYCLPVYQVFMVSAAWRPASARIQTSAGRGRVLLFVLIMLSLFAQGMLRAEWVLLMTLAGPLVFLFYIDRVASDQATVRSSSVAPMLFVLGSSALFALRGTAPTPSVLREYFHNPNMVGILSLNLSYLLILYAMLLKRGTGRLLCVALALSLIPLLIATQNRGSIFSLVLCVGAFAASYSRRRVPAIVVVGFLLLPVLIPFLQGSVLSYFNEDAVVFGKPVESGRTNIWANQLEEISGSLFALHRLSVGGLNMFLAGLRGYGLLGYFAYTLFVLSLCLQISVRLVHPAALFAFCAFLSIFFQQSFENTLVTGGFLTEFLSYYLLYVAAAFSGEPVMQRREAS